MARREIAKTVGKSRSYIGNTLRLLKLDENSKKELEDGNISPSQARTLLSIKDEDERKKSLNDFKNKKTNIRKVEKISKNKKTEIDKEDKLDRILFEDFEEKFIDILNHLFFLYRQMSMLVFTIFYIVLKLWLIHVSVKVFVD